MTDRNRTCPKCNIRKIGARFDVCSVCRESIVPDFNGPARLPHEPVKARPGTEAKIRVLERRAQLGVALFHPRDARAAEDLGDDANKAILAALQRSEEIAEQNVYRSA